MVLVDSNASSANNTANLNHSEPTQPQTEEELTTSTPAVTSPTPSAVTSTTTMHSSPEIISKQPMPNNATIEKFLHPFDIQRKLNGITADIGSISINQTLSSSPATTSTPTKVSFWYLGFLRLLSVVGHCNI